MNRPRSPGSPTQSRILRRVLLHYLFAALFLLLVALLWFASGVLLLIFGAILIAILLCAASAVIERLVGLRHGIALSLVLLLISAVIGTGVWLLAPSVGEQASQLASSLPDAFNRVREMLARTPVLEGLVQSLPGKGTQVDLRALVSRAGSVFSGLFGLTVNILIVLFLAVYLAAQPRLYVEGAVMLLPPHRRERMRAVLHRVGEALGLWLLGKMLAMLIVGMVTAVGLTMLGIPLALVLGLVAGVFEFIPYLGPILAGIPALLIAFTQGPTQALYVLLLFGAIQIAEGYLLQPMIERRMVSLPPALTISVQVLMAVPFGLLGVALATPLTATVAVMITMLYLQDVLGEHIEPPGSEGE